MSLFTKEDAAQAVEDVAATKAVIVKNGWYQGDLYRFTVDVPPHECPLCLLGALGVAIHGNVYGDGWSHVGGRATYAALYRRSEVARAYIASAIGDALIARWNDTEGRTVEEVYAALDRAAELAKADAA
jgi:hypothetical protein